MLVKCSYSQAKPRPKGNFQRSPAGRSAARKRKIAPHHLQRIHRQADMAELAGNIAMPSNRFSVEHQPPPTPVPRIIPITSGYWVNSSSHASRGQNSWRRYCRHIAAQTFAQIGPQPAAAGGGHVGGVERAIFRLRHARNTDAPPNPGSQSAGRLPQPAPLPPANVCSSLRRSDAFSTAPPLYQIRPALSCCRQCQIHSTFQQFLFTGQQSRP